MSDQSKLTRDLSHELVTGGRDLYKKFLLSEPAPNPYDAYGPVTAWFNLYNYLAKKTQMFEERHLDYNSSGWLLTAFEFIYDVCFKHTEK